MTPASNYDRRTSAACVLGGHVLVQDEMLRHRDAPARIPSPCPSPPKRSAGGIRRSRSGGLKRPWAHGRMRGDEGTSRVTGECFSPDAEYRQSLERWGRAATEVREWGPFVPEEPAVVMTEWRRGCGVRDGWPSAFDNLLTTNGNGQTAAVRRSAASSSLHQSGPRSSARPRPDRKPADARQRRIHVADEAPSGAGWDADVHHRSLHPFARDQPWLADRDDEDVGLATRAAAAPPAGVNFVSSWMRCEIPAISSSIAIGRPTWLEDPDDGRALRPRTGRRSVPAAW